MAKFYVTYSSGSNLANCFSVVEAPNYRAARNQITEVTQRRYAFMYDRDDWEIDTSLGPRTQQELYGLKEVPLQAQVKIVD